ncbi:hypothetical protein BC830DRAFT_1153659 [Chytriomyces sp. MP71]|nr:hypothetical protein BC830DRAFT_1153659 [Chytriomyces sp. MP71]
MWRQEAQQTPIAESTLARASRSRCVSISKRTGKVALCVGRSVLVCADAVSCHSGILLCADVGGSVAIACIHVYRVVLMCTAGLHVRLFGARRATWWPWPHMMLSCLPPNKLLAGFQSYPRENESRSNGIHSTLLLRCVLFGLVAAAAYQHILTTGVESGSAQASPRI